MPLLRLDKLSLAFGHRALLDQVDLELRRGERVCLVGRNGEGKSSLLRLIAGEISPDDGERWVRPTVRIAHLAQEVTLESDESVFDVVAGGLPEMGRLLSEYHHAAARLAHSHAEADIRRLEELQHELEAAGGWQLEQRVETVLSRLTLDGDASFGTLSGGWRRRVMLARALVCDPDLLLYQVKTCYALGNRMLNLQPGIHFQKVKVQLFIHQKLHRSCVAVPASLCNIDGSFAHFFPDFGSQNGGRRLFHYFLMPSLNAALSFKKVYGIAMIVGQDLKFDVPG